MNNEKQILFVRIVVCAVVKQIRQPAIRQCAPSPSPSMSDSDSKSDLEAWASPDGRHRNHFPCSATVTGLTRTRDSRPERRRRPLLAPPLAKRRATAGRCPSQSFQLSVPGPARTGHDSGSATAAAGVNGSARNDGVTSKLRVSLGPGRQAAVATAWVLSSHVLNGHCDPSAAAARAQYT